MTKKYSNDYVPSYCWLNNSIFKQENPIVKYVPDDKELKDKLDLIALLIVLEKPTDD